MKSSKAKKVTYKILKPEHWNVPKVDLQKVVDAMNRYVRWRHKF